MSNFSPFKFYPARLSRGKSWEIVYHAENPSTGEMKRFREKINHIKSIPERKRFGKLRVNQLNDQLYRGWNPFIDKDAPRGFVPLQEAMEVFFKIKSKELGENSIRSYRSFIDNLKQYLKKNKMDQVKAAAFNKMDALNYLDHVEMRIEASSTYNNYLRFFKLIFNWLVERQYAASNPFDGIKKRMHVQKTRTTIDRPTRIRIKKYLDEKDPDFMVVCLLVFHTLIRPGEIAQLKRRDFLMEANVIRVPAEIAKNKRTRLATIPNGLMEYLENWDFKEAKPHQYIFGTNYQAGDEPINPRRFAKKWDSMRKELGLPMEMKLYSLRDSGIIQMLQDGISPEQVRDQADHHSLDQTNVYTKFALAEANQQIIQKGSDF